MSDRRTTVLDAAISVAGQGGPRHLTHRAVDAQAGLPAGATSNVCRTRASLLAGMLERIAERERALWAEHTAVPPESLADFTQVLTAVLSDLSTTHRELTLARYAVTTESITDPSLRTQLATGRRGVVSWVADQARTAGSKDPHGDAVILMALIDGVLLEALTYGEGIVPAHSAADRLLGALLTT